MAAELELLGVAHIADPEWDQPRDEMVDVSAYTEAAIMCTVFSADVAGGSTTSVYLDTAVDNSEERFAELTRIAELTASPSAPETYYVYLQGPGRSFPDTPGFARYLRVVVDQDPASSLVLDVRAIMKSKGEGGGYMPTQRPDLLPGRG